MRKLLLVLGVVGCGTPPRTEPVAVAPATDAAPATIDGSAAPTTDAGADAGAGADADERPTLGDLGDDPGMNMGHGYGRSGAGGVGCKHPIVSKMTMGAPSSSSPAFDPTVVRQAIGPRRRDLQRCFDHVACARLIDYSMHVSFTIQPDGSVAAAQATTVNATIKQCMEGVLASLRLPKSSPGATVDVTYRITFRTSEP